jgi:hypothetical protein
MCVRKSIISLHRYSRANAKKRNTEIESIIPKETAKRRRWRSAREWGHARHAASKKLWDIEN